MAYPPQTNTFWTQSMSTNDECGIIVYEGTFTWNDLVACATTPGGDKIRIDKFIVCVADYSNVSLRGDINDDGLGSLPADATVNDISDWNEPQPSACYTKINTIFESLAALKGSSSTDSGRDIQWMNVTTTIIEFDGEFNTFLVENKDLFTEFTYTNLCATLDLTSEIFSNKIIASDPDGEHKILIFSNDRNDEIYQIDSYKAKDRSENIAKIRIKNGKCDGDEQHELLDYYYENDEDDEADNVAVIYKESILSLSNSGEKHSENQEPEHATTTLFDSQNVSSSVLCALVFVCIACALNMNRHNNGLVKCFIIQVLLNHISATYGIALVEPLPDDAFSASSEWGTSNCRARQSKFSDEAWCPSAATGRKWLQVNLGDEYVIESVSTKGSKSTSQSLWTTTYTIDYKRSIGQWVDYPNVLQGNTDRNTAVNNPLSGYIIAQYIRFYPETWNEWPAMRTEIYGYLYTESP
eukprot:168721_1